MQLNPTDYPDPNSRDIAQSLQEAGRSNLLRAEFLLQNPQLHPAYEDGLTRWFEEGPGSLDAVLADIETAWQQLDDS